MACGPSGEVAYQHSPVHGHRGRGRARSRAERGHHARSSPGSATGGGALASEVRWNWHGEHESEVVSAPGNSLAAKTHRGGAAGFDGGGGAPAGFGGSEVVLLHEEGVRG
jgi:hypothetical protein